MSRDTIGTRPNTPQEDPPIVPEAQRPVLLRRNAVLDLRLYFLGENALPFQIHPEEGAKIIGHTPDAEFSE